MSNVMLQIHYKSLVEGWLQRLKYPDGPDPIFSLRAPRRVFSLDTCSFEIRASRNTILVDGKAFAYNDLSDYVKTPREPWVTGWWSFIMMPKEIARLVNHLWRLDWEAETVAIELMRAWNRGHISQGDITGVMLSRLHGRLEHSEIETQEQRIK